MNNKDKIKLISKANSKLNLKQISNIKKKQANNLAH